MGHAVRALRLNLKHAATILAIVLAAGTVLAVGLLLISLRGCEPAEDHPVWAALGKETMGGCGAENAPAGMRTAQKPNYLFGPAGENPASLPIFLQAVTPAGFLARSSPLASESPSAAADGPGGRHFWRATVHHTATPSERAAIEEVESGGNPRAYNADEDARGVIQIRAIYVADANRILGVERFTHDDAYDRAKAWEMFEVVTSHYVRAYGYPDTFETRARIHNGGGKGPRRGSTLEYWRKVKEAKG